jgi:hypothetical protein
MSLYEQLLTFVGGFAVLAAALAWLSKTFISHLLSKEHKKHEANLNELHERNIEVLRKQLQRIEGEHGLGDDRRY